MSEKIKPCPCCGSNDVHAYADTTMPAYPTDYEIVCHKCGMRCSKSGKDKAIKTWNRRVDPSEFNVNKSMSKKQYKFTVNNPGEPAAGIIGYRKVRDE